MDPKTPTLATSPGNQSASPIDVLFLRLHTMYGARWIDLWQGIPADIVKAEWSRALAGVEVEQVRLALDAIVTKGNPFPPSMPEFVSLCRQFRKTRQFARLTDKRPNPPTDAFATLRSILSKGNPSQP